MGGPVELLISPPRSPDVDVVNPDNDSSIPEELGLLQSVEAADAAAVGLPNLRVP